MPISREAYSQIVLYACLRCGVMCCKQCTLHTMIQLAVSTVWLGLV